MSTASTYTVSGMTCRHCRAAVTEEVRELPGVEQVDVVGETGALTITTDAPVEAAAARTAADQAGYQLA